MKIIPFIILLCLTVSLSAQKRDKDDKLYLYDNKWTAAKTDNAVYLVAERKLNDTILNRMVYHYTGPLIRVETYKNEKADTPHGYLAFFGDDGKIDSSGYAFNGKKDSTWLFYDDTLAVVLKKEYNKGQLLRTTDVLAERKKDTSTGLLPGDKEADFKGGSKSWIRYLQKAVDFPERAVKLGIGGSVKVLFIVDTEGRILHPRILKSLEYTLDKEALRLIADAPRWIPAEQNGRKVKAFRIQPIHFSL